MIRKTNANVNPSQDENFLQENDDSEPVNKYSIKEAEENVTDKAILRENEHFFRLRPLHSGRFIRYALPKTESPQKKERPIPAVRGGDWAHLPLKALKKDRPGRAVLLPCKILAQDVQVSGGP